jgi:MFS family permease
VFLTFFHLFRSDQIFLAIKPTREEMLGPAVSGIGSACVQTGGFALIAQTFVDVPLRAKCLALAMAATNTGMLLGPFLIGTIFKWSNEEKTWAYLGLSAVLMFDILLTTWLLAQHIEVPLRDRAARSEVVSILSYRNEHLSNPANIEIVGMCQLMKDSRVVNCAIGLAVAELPFTLRDRR